MLPLKVRRSRPHRRVRITAWHFDGRGLIFKCPAALSFRLALCFSELQGWQVRKCQAESGEEGFSPAYSHTPLPQPMVVGYSETGASHDCVRISQKAKCSTGDRLTKLSQSSGAGGEVADLHCLWKRSHSHIKTSSHELHTAHYVFMGLKIPGSVELS